MEIDFITGRTKSELVKNVERKKADGWEVFGNGGIVEPKYKPSNLPSFIYHWRGMLRASGSDNFKSISKASSTK